jgi:acetyl esterase/lipase
MTIRGLLLTLCFLVSLAVSAQTQLPPAADWAVRIMNQYRLTPNITYLTANNFDAKLDVYARSDSSTPRPVLVNIHGGGWVGGTKEESFTFILPWIEMGWNVVNVEYRLSRVSPAPAAVEDCLCALRWVAANAKTYGFDASRIVTTGGSAGGHLALATGMIPESAGLDRQCPGVPLPRVAAIVNWFGITDVVDLLDGPNRKDYAVAWLGSMPNKVDVARRVSPLQYVRPDLPPILTIHGDADPAVPYAHATQLRDALTKAGVPNRLVTVPGGKHGRFTNEERVKIFFAIREFLSQQRLPINP